MAPHLFLQIIFPKIQNLPLAARECSQQFTHIGTDCFYLRPYRHVELVKFESAQDEDVITMIFVKHTVRLMGKNLRDLGIALHGHCVEFDKPMPERYSSLAGGDVAVTAIEIENKAEQGQ